MKMARGGKRAHLWPTAVWPKGAWGLRSRPSRAPFPTLRTDPEGALPLDGRHTDGAAEVFGYRAEKLACGWWGGHYVEETSFIH